jgi:hypothetical protein
MVALAVELAKPAVDRVALAVEVAHNCGKISSKGNKHIFIAFFLLLFYNIKELNIRTMNFLDQHQPEVIEKPKNNMKKSLLGLAVVLLLGASGTAAYYYKQYNTLKSNPNKAAQDETASTIAAVGKLIELPEGEQPTLATVTDPEKLKGQAFFAKAQKGDKVLVYTGAKKAILYSPTNNKIVEVAPVNIGESSNVSGTNTTNNNSGQ